MNIGPTLGIAIAAGLMAGVPTTASLLALATLTALALLPAIRLPRPRTFPPADRYASVSGDTKAAGEPQRPDRFYQVP